MIDLSGCYEGSVGWSQVNYLSWQEETGSKWSRSMKHNPVPSFIDGFDLMLSDVHSAPSVRHNGLFSAQDLTGSTRNVCWTCLYYYFRDNAPGQRECDEALEQINYTINQLDQASLAAISQQLEPRPENTLQVR